MIYTVVSELCVPLNTRALNWIALFLAFCAIRRKKKKKLVKREKVTSFFPASQIVTVQNVREKAWEQG